MELHHGLYRAQQGGSDEIRTLHKEHGAMRVGRLVIQALCPLILWLGWGLQAHAQTDTVTYAYTDPQGTPLVEADASGNVIARYDYTPYGNSVASLGNPPNGPGYTGHVNDPETGLVYMQARYYQPTGRFLSPDSIGPAPGDIYNFNRYAYVSNNPINKIDPTGNQEIMIAAPPPVLITEEPIIGPRGTPLTPLDQLPKGAADGPGSSKNFARAKPNETPPCAYCGRNTTREPGPDQHNNDHIIPKIQGGNNEEANRLDSCRTCNTSKGGRTPAEWYKTLINKMKAILAPSPKSPPPPPPQDWRRII